MDEKYTNRILSFNKNLKSLAEVRNRDISDEFVLSGAIQKYSITFDISWKVMKDALVGYFGIIDFATGSPRETLKKALSCGLIADDVWIDMMSDRNLLSHDYDGEIAKSTISTIINVYIPVMETFAKRMDDIYKIGVNDD